MRSYEAEIILAKLSFARILPLALDESDTLFLDLSENNAVSEVIYSWGSDKMQKWIDNQLQFAFKKALIGGYLEKRTLYHRSKHFNNGTEKREFHLGIDIWTQAGMPIFAPYDAVVHSFQDNNRFGDYGPTIILEHQAENIKFYTLYGHLSRKSLENKKVGQTIKQGEQFAEIGNYPENGDWSPHLHFQVILDMQGWQGDFPGVCSAEKLNFYKQICPNPNLILKSSLLE
ncbi:peptidoglycan DD-metalloendopeptidase family protein [Raineya orbicola]|jgi:murein DD-endopeptidase MepM/ murein hydrolase activator NlpD|uniref:Peptidase family M23 n=1 Tax=Raineya orbicola TaxID=2016530 RepID=A0A2N3IC41_9BACT|nr:peptidoglycan DD-metalloendopeptidase family protein [Raineya orbicola]PKQ67845.1 Peptidase family M23 [Raineya orbicola]